MSHNNREKGGRVVFIGNIPYGQYTRVLRRSLECDSS